MFTEIKKNGYRYYAYPIVARKKQPIFGNNEPNLFSKMWSYQPNVP